VYVCVCVCVCVSVRWVLQFLSVFFAILTHRIPVLDLTTYSKWANCNATYEMELLKWIIKSRWWFCVYNEERSIHTECQMTLSYNFSCFIQRAEQVTPRYHESYCVSIVKRLQAILLRKFDSVLGRTKKIFSPSERPDRTWSAPNLLHNGCWRIFLWGLGGRWAKLIIHPPGIRTLRMSSGVTPPPYRPSCRAQK
jgi:hypothetical protein